MVSGVVFEDVEDGLGLVGWVEFVDNVRWFCHGYGDVYLLVCCSFLIFFF